MAILSEISVFGGPSKTYKMAILFLLPFPFSNIHPNKKCKEPNLPFFRFYSSLHKGLCNHI